MLSLSDQSLFSRQHKTMQHERWREDCLIKPERRVQYVEIDQNDSMWWMTRVREYLAKYITKVSYLGSTSVCIIHQLRILVELPTCITSITQ